MGDECVHRHGRMKELVFFHLEDMEEIYKIQSYIK